MRRVDTSRPLKKGSAFASTRRYLLIVIRADGGASSKIDFDGITGRPCALTLTRGSKGPTKMPLPADQNLYPTDMTQRWPPWGWFWPLMVSSAPAAQRGHQTTAKLSGDRDRPPRHEHDDQDRV